jgi:N-acetylmuramoyl-L-alanine amidase
MYLITTPSKIAFATAIIIASSALMAQNNQQSKQHQYTRELPKSVQSHIRKIVHKPGKKEATHKTHTKTKSPITYRTAKRVRLNAKEKACLTRNVYHEARGEPYTGKLAVAQVTWNRVESRKWGTSVCNVVYAPSQFSWTSDPKKRFKSPRNADWLTSERIVADYTQGLRVTKLDDATYFHATRLGRPQWTRHLKKRLAIGNHVFYD